MANRWSIIVLIGLMFLIGLERWHTYNEPIERDIAGYAVIGHEMLRGRLLYSDLWERKPPLMYVTFAAAEIVVGYGKQEIFFINVITAWITLLGIFVAGQGAMRFDSKRSSLHGGLIAAFLWAILGADLYSQANQPNGEVFINASLSWAFALLVMWPQKRRRYWAAVVLGILFAAGTLSKHHVVIICAMLLCGHILTAFRLPQITRRTELLRRMIESTIAAGVLLAAWVAVMAYFAASNRLHTFLNVLFRENADYAGNILDNLSNFSTAIFHSGPAVWWMIGPVGLTVAWLLLGAGRIAEPERMPVLWLRWTLWAVGTWCAIAIPGHFFAHYYQLAMPPMIIAAAWCAAILLSARPGIRRTLGQMAIVTVMVFAAIQQGRFYRLTPEQWSDEKAAGNFVEQYRLAGWLNAELRPDEQFWQYGQDNTLYFATRRSPPTGLLYASPLMEGTQTQYYWQRLFSQLEQNHPDMVLLTTLKPNSVGFETPILPWLRKNYVDVGINPQFPNYVFLLRNDSELRQRLPIFGFKPDHQLGATKGAREPF